MRSPLFLAWLRRGLARGIGGRDDPAGGALPRRGAITAAIGLADSRGVEAVAEASLAMAAPGDVVGIDAAQVVRMVPPDGALDVEANYIPFVELAAPDLPWILTPAQPTVREQLRPWLVLVCVEQREGIDYDAAAQPLPVLRLGADEAAAELPDLAESWAWTHVQSLVPAPEVEAEVEQGSGAVTARLMCPRRLVEGRAYRAALVPAFDVGVAAGLGEDASEFAVAGPAWRRGDMPPSLELPVYLTWTFATGTEPGDFEDLARLLEPDLAGGRMGFHAARLIDTGLLEPYQGDTGFEYEGALVDPGSEGAVLDRKANAWFGPGLRAVLDASAQRLVVPRRPPADYDPTVDDPVLAPPLHGSWAADEYAVPDGGWLEELNVDPRRRSAAGLGAGLVRLHQHELLAAAWDQAGDLRALREELNRARLAAEVGRSLARRLSALSDAALLQTTERLQVFVEVGGLTGTQKLERSAVVPAALVSPAFARQTMPGAVLSRRAGRALDQTAIGTRSVERFVAASVVHADRSDDEEGLARFGATFVGAGTVTSRTAFVLVPLDRFSDDDPATDVVAVERFAPIGSARVNDVTGLAATVRGSLDPMASIVAGLDRRIGGIDLDLATDLPTRIPIGARFPDPLFPKLEALGSDLIVPGIDELAANRVRLLAVNESWLAAFLAGANHEWAREALWNEYPADLDATAFSTFWPRIPIGTTDLARDMHEWPLDEGLAEQVGAAGGSIVMVVRGDLIRRYPDAEFMLVAPAGDGSLVDDHGDLPPGRTTWPSFTGHLDTWTLLVGFDVDPQTVWDEGWYAGIQEPVAGPRFGLDYADPDHFGRAPAAWADASWGHLAASADGLDAMTHIRFGDVPWLAGVERGGLEWGRNSAHLAGITFQQPFRLLLPATSLMPPPGGAG